MAGITHKFVSGVGDGGDTTLVRPSNWNDSHSFVPSVAEVSLGSAPDAFRSGHFQITGLSGLTAGNPVLIQQANGSYTNKGTRDDEAEMDQVLVTGKVLNNTTIQCYWKSQHRVRGNIKFNYLAV